jgi:5-methyltetrahydrofolate--homocysteine methyltransferase
MLFEEFDWGKVTETWEKWWEGTLGRPVFFTWPPEREAPDVKLPNHRFMPMYDFSIPAREILEAAEKRSFRGNDFLGDSFPAWWPNFGAGALAAMTGGGWHNGDDTVWFTPGRFEGARIGDIRMELDKDRGYFRRIEEFFNAAAELWNGKVQCGMTDIGGTLDVVSSFRPGEALLLDLFDSPEEVKRLTWETHGAWREVFDHFNRIINPANRGRHTAWTPMLSRKSWYMLQCDFCYMISPDMFKEFVLPELAASCREFSRSFYHLDGKGELPHLDHILSIPELTGVQWVPGAGQASAADWPEVLNKIVSSGKKVQVWGGSPGEIRKILGFLEKPEAAAFFGGCDEGILKDFGAL